MEGSSLDPSLAPGLVIAAAALIGYLAGSIPFGLVLVRLAGLGDVREIGSGSIGATNVLRTGSKALALGTFVGDAAKGGVVVLLFKALGIALPYAPLVAGVAAFLGHLFPVWLGFKGGKGISTFIGILATLFWPAALFFCAVWLAVALTFRISSLSALVASVLTPVFIWFLATPELFVASCALTVLIYYAHRQNIARLLNGTEPKIGAKKDDETKDAA